MHENFGGRKWVKLWVREWLDGTTRAEMSDSQRAFWIDLLAMAGCSRYPGIICAGQINGQYVGYPLNKFQQLMTDPIDIESTFELFVNNDKIKLEITRELPFKLYKITILKWDQYQSEYHRQRPYRQKLQSSDTESYTSSYSEQSIEGEVEGEVEGEERSISFDIFWDVYPRRAAKVVAQKAWKKLNPDSVVLTAILSGIENWKKTDQWKDIKFVPLPATFINQRRWEDEIPKEPSIVIDVPYEKQ